MLANPPPGYPDAIDPPAAYCGGQPCAEALDAALAALRSRWAAPVLEALALAGAPLRFGALRQPIAGLSAKELARQLALLGRLGIARRTAGGYALTPAGRALLPTLEALGRWARHAGLAPEPAPAAAASWLGPLRQRGDWG